jgi:HAD superfamily hydrolase (TIGR01490 family)
MTAGFSPNPISICSQKKYNQSMTKGKKFAAFDIDGTLIRWQLYHAIVDALARLGYIDTSAFESIHMARMAWKTRTHAEAFKAYERELVGLYDQALTSLSTEQFSRAISAVFDEYKDQVYTFTRDLIKDLKTKGYVLFAISGSQTEIVKMIADYYGFDDFSGSTYVQRDGKFTGEVILPFLHKDKVLSELVSKHNVGFKGSIAVGDSAGDVKMLEAVEKPIAFNPEQKLFDKAKQRGWKIVIERKNMVYELEMENGKYQLA